MRQRFKVTPSVFMAVVRDGQILLTKRKNTGFMDGYYDMPSGHVEEGESLLNAAVRELEEETTLKAKPQDLRLIHVGQSRYTSEGAYIYFLFKVLNWQGEPANPESHKSDEVSFYPMNKLPKTVPHILQAIKNLDGDRVTFEVITLTEAEFLRQ